MHTVHACVSDVLECARQDAKVAEQALAGVQQCSTSSTAGLPQALWRCQIPHTKTRLPLKNDMTSWKPLKEVWVGTIALRALALARGDPHMFICGPPHQGKDCVILLVRRGRKRWSQYIWALCVMCVPLDNQSWFGLMTSDESRAWDGTVF